jgi:geranylgeranyl pyrophosphate synthase
LATAPSHQRPTVAADALVAAAGSSRRSDHLKEVPSSPALREQIRAGAVELASRLDKTRLLVRHEMEAHARALLAGLQLPEAYVGWTMVALASAFWRDQVAAVPHARRLLLLPHCLRSTNACLAAYNELGLLCRDCGACSLTELRAEALRQGYKVMIAEGSPTVMKLILGGHVDALLGVACLDALEKTLDKILLAGIPCLAVPLVRGGCQDTAAEHVWVRQMIDTPYRPAAVHTRTYLHLMRCAAKMFEPAELERLLPCTRGGPTLAESNGQGLEGLAPVACTEALARDFLAAGGKHTRPFITLAVYDALCGGGATGGHGAEQAARLPQAVRRIALAIEIFHKASLVHDDIEDDDAFRYGRPTLHRKYGLATALNVGDYLIGLGYRLVAGQRQALGADVAADVLAQFAEAHTRLCEGQGAELLWRDARQKRLQPLEALTIYALKTAPAFEAAIMAGIRLAGPTEPYHEPAARFARHLGVAYQMLNDLDDWQVEQPNKLSGGSDVLGGRPTVLWALALEALGETDRRELESLLQQPAPKGARIARAGQLYARADVYRRAAALICKHHQRARQAADRIEVEPLRHLLYFLADAILDRRPLAISEEG